MKALEKEIAAALCSDNQAFRAMVNVIMPSVVKITANRAGGTKDALCIIQNAIEQVALGELKERLDVGATGEEELCIYNIVGSHKEELKDEYPNEIKTFEEIIYEREKNCTSGKLFMKVTSEFQAEKNKQ